LTAASEGSRYVTLGLAPLAGSLGWLGIARRFAGALYDFDGVWSFRAKLQPQRWDPIYIGITPSGADRRLVANGLVDSLAISVAIVDTLTAFARGRLVGFGVETLLRGPAFVVRLLAAALVPWTVLLAIAGDRYFPSPAVKWAWVGIDAALSLALFSLAARWRRWLGVVLAMSITVDAAATALQVVLFNLGHVRGIADGLLLAAGTAAPALAAFVLWKSLGQQSPADAPRD
jgi:phosphatidylglycerol lysyltransferase